MDNLLLPVLEELKSSTSRELQLAVEFMSKFRKQSGIGKAFIGISGGADSALCAHVLKQSGYSVTGLLMPSSATSESDLHDALKLCSFLGIESSTIPIQPIVNSFAGSVPAVAKNLLAAGNVAARIRMSILYAHSNLHKGIVAGTGDKSEYLLGYFTKFGDSGCDVFPLLHMYKTQVRHALSVLGMGWIADKSPSPNLWQGQTAESELGLSYELADCIMHSFCKGSGLSEFPPQAVRTVASNHVKTIHKRSLFSTFNQKELSAFGKLSKSILDGEFK